MITFKRNTIVPVTYIVSLILFLESYRSGSLVVFVSIKGREKGNMKKMILKVGFYSRQITFHSNFLNKEKIVGLT